MQVQFSHHVATEYSGQDRVSREPLCTFQADGLNRANKKRKQSVQDTPSSESVEYDHVHSIYSPQPIRDHNNDIAEAGNRAKMRVRLPNRHTFERVYLQAKTAGKTTTVAWDPSHFSSADQNFTSVEKSAGGAGESVTECLVVGLVIGSDPTLHIKPSAGAPGSKVKEDPLFMSEQHQDVLRAVIITSKNKKTKASYYVACKPEQGRCAVRIIDRKSIFFFSEFCFGVYQSTNSGRLDAIQRNALKAATRNKMNDVNEDLDILSRTKSEHLLEELNHHFGQYMNFNHQEHLDVMENHLDLAALDLSFGPYTENYGTATFYCYAMDFTISHARMVMVELKVCSVCQQTSRRADLG